MNDSFSNPGITVGDFKTQLIVSEIVVTALVLIAFYFIFNSFNKKNKQYKEQNEI
jgi:hypothetical protein